MKVLILGFTKLRYMPYLTFYLNAIDSTKNDITVLTWNRDGKADIEYPKNVAIITFSRFLIDSNSKIKKIPAFISYRNLANKIIKKGKYDYIISLHTLPAVLINRTLCKKYKGKFILDYRDYTYEKNNLYRKLITRLVNCSDRTFVSSEAFMEFLPRSEKILISHNILLSLMKNRQKPHKLNICPIRIRYWGMISYADTNIELIKKIKNDSRFELHFHGRFQGSAKKIQQYCIENDVNNVYFHGEYKPEERLAFAKETDLIQNVQDYNNITKNAMSNKFYDGAIFYIPQICFVNSYMGKCASEYGIGLACNVYDADIADKIFSYVKDIDLKKFNEKCDTFVDKIFAEYKKGIDTLDKIFNM